MRQLKELAKKILSLRAIWNSAVLRGNAGEMARHKKLHLGCGPVKIPGFLNVDSQALHSVDFVCAIQELERHYPAGNAEMIYACHVLEHLSHEDAPETLRLFHRLLAAGGELRLSVPDMDRIVKIYSKNWAHFQTPGNSPWIGLIWGGQLDAYDFHKTGFNFCWLKHLLDKAGFQEIEEYPHEPHFLGIQDGSMAKEPFGEYISLNVRAIKPKAGPTTT